MIAEGSKEQAIDQAKRSGAAIGDFIREQREQAQVSLRQLARLAGVSNPYLSQIERGLRKPSADILQQIAKGLRISAEQLYVRAGILETRAGDPSVVSAILSDPVLGERQKQVLVDIYESFHRENAQRDAGNPHPGNPHLGNSHRGNSGSGEDDTRNDGAGFAAEPVAPTAVANDTPVGP